MLRERKLAVRQTAVEREKKNDGASSVVGIDSLPVCPRDIICSSPYGARYETPGALKRHSMSQTRMRANNLLKNDTPRHLLHYFSFFFLIFV